MSVSIKDKITTNTFKQLVAVQIATSLVALAGNVIDGVIISRFLGPVCMSGYGIGTPFVIIMVAFGYVLAAGSQALCGGHMGRGEIREVELIMNRVIRMAVFLGVCFNALLFFFPVQIASLLGAEGEILTACSDYLRTYSFSAYGMLLTPVMVGFMQMDRDGKRALKASCTYVVSSTALDLLNVLVLKWGMTGMGLTTALAYVMSITVYFFHFASKDRCLSLRIRGGSLKGIGKVFELGFPAATYHICNFIKVYSTNLIVLGLGGTAGIFSASVLQSVNSIVVGFFTGVGSTTLLMSSVIAGEENRRSLHHTLKFIVRLASLLGLFIACVVFISSDLFLADFFCKGESEIYRQEVVVMLRFLSAAIPFCMVNTVFINYFQAMKNVKMSALLCILDNAVYAVALMLLFSGLFGLHGVWLSMCGAELATHVSLAVITWVRRKKLPKSLHDLMNLPEDFGVEEGRRMNLTVTSNEELEGICDKILTFCKARGVEEKKAFAAAHCMEELAAIAMGNRKNKGKTYVDIYLTETGGELKLRMRDNTVPMDVEKLGPDSGSDESLGMKIVYGMAKEANYSVVLGLNVFTLVL